MASISPSVAIEIIDDMFGVGREIHSIGKILFNKATEVRALVAVIEQIPSELITLTQQDFIEYNLCKAKLALAIGGWTADGGPAVGQVRGKDPVELLRQLLARCPDKLPPAAPKLSFIADDKTREDIEARMRAAWTDFSVNEWMGATVFGAATCEALLFWALTHFAHVQRDDLNKGDLHKFSELAAQHKLITEPTRQHLLLARDCRNLMHPERADRLESACDQATALTALAALHHLIAELQKSSLALT